MEILSVHDINKSFGVRKILKNVSFSLEKGEFMSIVGLSGSGKSTLFNIISGLEKPDSGKIFLGGRNITEKTGEVSYMFQKDLLFPYYTIMQNVILPLVIHGVKKEDAKKRAEDFFVQFGLEGCEDSYPHELSGGMKQRAALLRTYLFSKDLMLLDEPFSALDMITKSRMQDWYLRTMEKFQTSTILITHDIEEAILLSDRILILENACEQKNTNILREIKVSEKRPRSRDFCYTSDFIGLKKEIAGLLV